MVGTQGQSKGKGEAWASFCFFQLGKIIAQMMNPDKKGMLVVVRRETLRYRALNKPLLCLPSVSSIPDKNLSYARPHVARGDSPKSELREGLNGVSDGCGEGQGPPWGSSYLTSGCFSVPALLVQPSVCHLPCLECGDMGRGDRGPQWCRSQELCALIPNGPLCGPKM